MRLRKEPMPPRLLILGKFSIAIILIPVKWSMTFRYEIFTQIIEEGTVPDLYKKFSV
jgi:hypothetical protein